MRIGIVRHFPVNYKINKIIGPKNFSKWILQYDTLSLKKIKKYPDLNNTWDICISSDLPRAIATAEIIHQDTIIENKLLREVPFSVVPIIFPMPIVLWIILSRISWWFGIKSKVESRKSMLIRCQKVVEHIDKTYPGKSILIVTHGFFMHYLYKELIKN